MASITKSALSIVGTAVSALAGTLVGNGARLLIKAKREGVTGNITITGSLSSAATATLLAQKVDSMKPLVAFGIGAVLGGALGDEGDKWIMRTLDTLRSSGDTASPSHTSSID